MHLTRTLQIMLSLALLPLFAACSGSAASGSISPSPELATPINGSLIPEIATDNRFSLASIAISTEESYSLSLSNKGDAVHNWHVLGVRAANGSEIESPLIDGGKTATISFSIPKPGVYRFQCDVHPDTMKGTLTVR
jgi:cupredoxin-like protein